ncbi:hypothetical protein CSB45_01510 [candidate division KSB3 bacterium]|uniref:FAD-binding PCMH-type domain-containing protein n=1 Tax=candidate division KSB3 bacterium TaxID=2044937 RepID=A0A2G6EAJ6_9BACT|nr:MAG: hypothetical protein CSB45_01510 [candidate division KSB3 bacterium]PIE30728.1 MAG: hypothetical protein CSA57_01840 [candidate division KSB3 bacterium]
MLNARSKMDADVEFETQALGGKDLAYLAPLSLQEAEDMKAAHPEFQFFAGGTILNWRAAPRAKGLIDLKNLALDEIDVTPESLAIGAMVTIQELTEYPGIPKAVSSAAGLFSSRNVRNMATVGGTAAGRFFVSDLLPVFLAYRADVKYFLGKKMSTLPLSQWLQARSGILCSIVIRQLDRNVAFRQEKISKIDFPLIVTAVGWKKAGTQIKEAVVAISGASGKMALSESGAACLEGKDVSVIESSMVNAAVQQDLQPTESIKASSRVKRRIVESQLKGIIAELQKEGAL